MDSEGEPTGSSGWDALMRAAERERREEEAAAAAPPPRAPGARGAVTRSELFGLRALRDRLAGDEGDER